MISEVSPGVSLVSSSLLVALRFSFLFTLRIATYVEGLCFMGIVVVIAWCFINGLHLSLFGRRSLLALPSSKPYSSRLVEPIGWQWVSPRS